MLTELLAAHGDFTPGRWVPCPRVSDRAAWDNLPGFDRWLSGGGEAARAGRRVPALPLSLWTDFTRTGNRARYEHAYFARRRTLCRLVMAECMGDTGEFLPRIADYLWAICEESAWQLPAHNSYLRDAPQLPLPDPSRPVVDLFAAETGALLAMVHFLLGRQLDAAFPGLDARLTREVDRRVVRPWSTTHFWWMGSGEEPMCNWTTWCTQNCLIATALLHPGSPARIRAAVARAAASVDCFLKDYGEDGCCSEGAQYYRHAGLTLFNTLELLCALAPGVFDTVWQQPKLRNIAQYIAQMHVCGPWYLNFSDCSPLAGRRGAREYLFGKRVGSQALMALAAADFAADPDPDRIHAADDSEGINLFYLVQSAFAEQEILDYAATAAPCTPADIWYPSVGLRVCRAGSFTVGIKAGCNADSHNHNDTGSVTLYKDGHPLLIDIGVETYSKKTFSPRRYEIWTMQSCWHNLPRFVADGRAYDQLAGPRYAARQVRPLDGGLAMDLAPAYGAVPGLGYYHRTARLTAAGLELCDETDFAGTVELTLMSEQPPAAAGQSVAFGALARAELCGGVQQILTEAVPVTDARLRTAWPETIYRTRIRFTGALRVFIG